MSVAIATRMGWARAYAGARASFSAPAARRSVAARRWWRRPRSCCCARADAARPGPRAGASLLQRRTDRAGATTSAPASCWLSARARRRAGRAGAGRAPAAARLRGARRPVLAGAAAGAGALAGAGGGDAAGARRRARAGQGRRPGRPSAGGGWAGDVVKAEAIGAMLAARRRRAADRRACAASGGAGGSRAPRAVVGVRRRDHLRRAGRARPDLQQVHAAAGRAAARRRARARAPRRASTSARSTRSTPRAARRPPTPTSPGSGHTKRVVLYDNLIKDFTPGRGAPAWSPTSSATCATATSRTGCSGSRWSRRSGMFAVGAAGRAAGAARRRRPPPRCPAVVLALGAGGDAGRR